MKVLCVFGQHQYGDPSRGLGTEYAAFIPALRLLGHEVRHFESWNRAAYRDFAELNQKLLDTVESYRPDLMLTVQMGYELWLETIELISARGDVATISWAADDSWKYREVSRFIGHAYHAMATTYDYVVPRYHADGIAYVLLTQWGVPDAWLAPPMPACECRHQVSFVGAAHGDRRELVDRLCVAGIDVACFGHGWPNGPVAMEDIPRIMRESVISLNFANSKGMNQIKARTFEVPGSGGFLISEHAPGIERFYQPGREIAIYRDFDDLVSKIHYYLTHTGERDALANAGYQRTAREYSYARRMQAVVEYASKAQVAGVERHLPIPITEAIGAHRLTWWLRLLRRGLIAVGHLLYGPVRGPRAARRLAFELSWRMAGRHTFTSSGWPGRMFYRET